MDELKGIFQNTPLSCAFLSKQNIDSLQTNIRYSVWLKTNKKHVIGKQSDKELNIIMRSVYLQYSKNLPNNILAQVKELNKIVLDYAVDKIIVQLKQYIEYQKHINGKREILPHSINMSSRGSKQLSIKPWF